MGATKKPRRPYRPREVHLNTIERVIENVAIVDQKQAESCTARVEQSIGFLMCGEAPDHHWRVLADAMNVSETMSDMGICSDADSLQAILGAQAVLGTLAGRQAATGSWAMHAEEIATLRDGIARHAIQLRFISNSEYQRAIEMTRARVIAARNGQGKRPVIAIGKIGS